MTAPAHVRRELVDDRLVSAYHEAGHVVGFLAGGLTADRVTLTYERVGWRRWVVNGDTRFDHERAQMTAEWRIGVAAGPVAAALWLQQRSGGSYRRCLRHVLRHEARDDQRALRRLCVAQYGSYRAAFRSARIVVRRYWSRVATVAEALNNSGDLSGRQIRRLLRIPEGG